jgi:hypothetical protein
LGNVGARVDVIVVQKKETFEAYKELLDLTIDHDSKSSLSSVDARRSSGGPGNLENRNLLVNEPDCRVDARRMSCGKLGYWV